VRRQPADPIDHVVGNSVVGSLAPVQVAGGLGGHSRGPGHAPGRRCCTGPECAQEHGIRHASGAARGSTPNPGPSQTDVLTVSRGQIDRLVMLADPPRSTADVITIACATPAQPYAIASRNKVLRAACSTGGKAFEHRTSISSSGVNRP
jgi:hypothetical protein